MTVEKVGARRWRGFVGAGLLLAAAGSVQGQTPVRPPAISASAPARDDTQTVVRWLEERLQQTLSVTPDHTADADLRSAAVAMVEREMPRMRRLLAAWVEEERALGLEQGTSDLFMAVSHRVQNELALWRLDSAGPEHDRRQQAALARPQACELPPRTQSLMDGVLQVWQQVPAAQRAAYLRSESELLQRWGTARAEPPPRPPVAVEAAAWRTVDDYLEQQKALPDPLPPLLAWRLLSGTPERAQRRHLDTLCALRQWALRTALREGQGRLDADLWLAHRYARMPQHVPPDDEAPVKADAYPELARRLRVEGNITVEITVDAQGRKLGTRVVKRAMRVPGIRGQRALPFETLLDAASLARAAGHPTPKPEKLNDGRGVFTLEYVYKLQ